MIPWLLFRNHQVKAELVCYRNGDYPSLQTDYRDFPLHFIKKTIFGRYYDGMHYLKYEAESIDVLNLYHLNAASFLYERVYQKYNPLGRIYLKLDLNNKGFADCFRFTLKGMVKRAILKKADIVSVENTDMYEALKKRFGEKVIFLPNGYCIPDTPETGKKENILLTVGNLGTPEKATDLLLNAFAKSADHHDYTLRLIGPVMPAFEQEIDAFFQKYPHLKDRITFPGPIADRKELLSEYAKARYFLLPSRSESFGFVLLEAALCGCYLIVSDGCSAARDITNNERFGTIVPADDEKALSDALIRLCREKPDEEASLQRENEEAAYIRQAYDWNTIIKHLYQVLTPRQEELLQSSGPVSPTEPSGSAS